MTDDQRRTLIQQYAEGPEQVAESLAGFPPEGLVARPIEGKWSACEIVQHLGDSESISAIRLRRLIAEDHAVIHGYDQAEYARRLRYNERPLDPALRLFREARAATVPLLRSMTAEDWSRRGWHTESGLYTPEHWLAIYAVHAHDHAAQIRRLKEALTRR